MRIFSLLLITSVCADLAAFNRYRNSAASHAMKRRTDEVYKGLSTQDQHVIAVMMLLLKRAPNQAAMDKFDQIIRKIKTQKSTNNRLRRYLSH